MRRCAALVLALALAPAAAGQVAPWSPVPTVDGEWLVGELDGRIARATALAAPERDPATADARARELAAVVRAVPEEALRAAALEALSNVEGALASQQLAALVGALAADEDLVAAEALVARPDAGRPLLELLGARGVLRGEVLVALLDGLDEAFAAEGVAADARLFTLARLHPDPDVRAAADTALTRTLDRLGSQRDDARALALLERLGGAWTPNELDLRAALYLVRAGRQLERAAAHATAVWERPVSDDDWDATRTRFLSRYLLAAAELAADEPERAYETLLEALVLVEAAIAQRPDLQPEPGRPSKHGGSVAADFLALRGLVELCAAHAAIATGRPAGDPVVLNHVRNAHEASLWAQLRRLATNDQAGFDSLDDLFDHDLGPRRLVFSAPDNPHWSGPGRNRALDVLLGVGQAAAVVAPSEVPGFTPPPAFDPAFLPTVEDPRRATLLKLMQPAQLTAVQRRLNQSWDLAEIQMLELRRRILSEAIERAIEDDHPDLETLRLPSLYALTMAADLDRDNRAPEAVVLAEQLFADLDAKDRLDDGANGSWLAARIELELGGALGEAGRPRDAVPVLESAVARLEAIENTLVERRSEEEERRRLAIYDAQIEQTRRLRSQVLVSLAVNANVRLGDPETALGYFERAYALDDSEFMRGLLACYRARFGQEDEARKLLRTIRPTPPVYYNLACAYALLGDVDAALEMLARELAENHPSPGALARQKRWAREDPDLAGLAEDPRFRALTQP